MKPTDPLTAQTAGALMSSALDRLRAKHGAPDLTPIPRPAPPVEVEIPDWLADDPALTISERVKRTQRRIALAHGRVTLAELEAERSPPAASASEQAPDALAPHRTQGDHRVVAAPVQGLTATPDTQGVGATEEIFERFAAAPSSVLSAAPAPVRAPAARFCLHCSGRDVHRQDCSAYRSGYVAHREPCSASLRELSEREDDRGGGRSTWHAAIEVEPAPPAPPTDGDPLAADSAWLQGAGLLAQLQPGAAPLNPSTGVGAALQRALEQEGDVVLRRLRYALSEPSEGALRESIAAGDVSLGALVPARPSATTRRLDDGAARPVLRVLVGGRR